MCLLSSWAAVDRAHPLDVLEGLWGGGRCFWSHLSTCFVLTFVKEENHGRRKERGWWRNETGFGNVSADRWWRLMELGRVPRSCQSIALVSSETLHVFRWNGRVLVLFRQAFCQVCHDSFIFASIHLSNPYVINAPVDLPHQTDFEEYKLALNLLKLGLLWVNWWCNNLGHLRWTSLRHVIQLVDPEAMFS